MSKERTFAGAGFSRRLVLRSAALYSCFFAAPFAVKAAPKPNNAQTFADFLQSLWPAAEAQGVRRETFNEAIANLSFDSSVPSGASTQAEFDRPLHVYLANAVTAQRVARGREEAVRWQAELQAVEMRFGVPGEILLAAWGMETGFGGDAGTKDILRSLASLAYTRADRNLFADEFVAALVIFERGVPRDKLKGSWAGAMGNPQFLPSAYLKYAVSFNGGGAPDIWTSVPDTLASIAHFLRESGWQPGLPWGMEVLLPADFDYASLHMTFPAWTHAGINAADERGFPAAGDAVLFLPSGAGGPAFLLSDNYWVLKAYNNSDSYALSLALLANRVAGGGGLHTAWPVQEKMLSRSEKSEIQRRLIAGGYYSGTVDGRFGPASRDAIHDFQRAAGINPADGYGSAKILQALRGLPR